MAQAKIHRDGTVEVLTASQDIGGGARTVAQLIASRYLGWLSLDKIKVKIGDSDYGSSGASAGSSTTRGLENEVQRAVQAVLQKLFEVVAPKMGAAGPRDCQVIEGPKVSARSGKTIDWDEACGMLKDSIMSYAPTIVEPGSQWALVRDDGTIEQATEENYKA